MLLLSWTRVSVSPSPVQPVQLAFFFWVSMIGLKRTLSSFPRRPAESSRSSSFSKLACWSGRKFPPMRMRTMEAQATTFSKIWSKLPRPLR